MKISKQELKRIIREEGYYKSLPQHHVDGHPWSGRLEDLAFHQGRTWGHGSVVDEKEYAEQIKKSTALAMGRDKSILKLNEYQIRSIIRESLRSLFS